VVDHENPASGRDFWAEKVPVTTLCYSIKHFDENAAREYGIIKKDLKDKNFLIGPFDMLIGAHAKSLNMTLVTNNVREFERIQDLKIENWA